MDRPRLFGLAAKRVFLVQEGPARSSCNYAPIVTRFSELIANLLIVAHLNFQDQIDIPTWERV